MLAVQVASEPPHLDYIGDKVAVIGSPFQLTLQATDLDQQPLTFTAIGLAGGRDPRSQPRSMARRVSTGCRRRADARRVWRHVRGHQYRQRQSRTGRLRSADHPPGGARRRPGPGADKSRDSNRRRGRRRSQLNLSATDPDGDPLTYSVANPPTGSTFDPAHGIFTWTPNLIQAGTYPNVVFGASDGNN